MTASSQGPNDDLKRIRGIGVLIEKRLNAMGIARYEQIANWTSGEIDRVSQMLEFKGRIERESWVEQARILSMAVRRNFRAASIAAKSIPAAKRDRSRCASSPRSAPVVAHLSRRKTKRLQRSSARRAAAAHGLRPER